MKSIYFVRHGESVWNVENKICGRTDVELTKKGHDQAVELGRLICEEKIVADKILYSPLIRAKQTALHISEITGIDAIESEELIEQHFGCYESTPRDSEEFKVAKSQFTCRYNGGESMFQMAQRIYNFLDRLKEDETKDAVILVAHNGISRIIHSYFYEMSNDEFASFGIKNCSIQKYDF